MNEHLHLAMRRAIWAKDTPRQDPRYVAPPQVPKPPAPPPPPPPQVEVAALAPGVDRDRIGIILRTVAAAYDVSVEGILGPRRGHGITRPRHVAVYITYVLLENLSLPQIGKRFHRDHTSILHAIRIVEARRVDQWYEGQLQQLMNEVREKLNA